MIGLEHWAISFAKFKKPFFTKLLQFGTKKTHSASPLALQLVGTPLQWLFDVKNIFLRIFWASHHPHGQVFIKGNPEAVKMKIFLFYPIQPK